MVSSILIIYWWISKLKSWEYFRLQIISFFICKESLTLKVQVLVSRGHCFVIVVKVETYRARSFHLSERVITYSIWTYLLTVHSFWTYSNLCFVNVFFFFNLLYLDLFELIGTYCTRFWNLLKLMKTYLNLFKLNRPKTVIFTLI